MFLPILPKPLIPTLMVIRCAPVRGGQKPREARTKEKPEGWTDVMLGGAASSLWRAWLAGRLSQLLEPSQAVIDGGLRKLHPARQLAEVELRVCAAPASHLAKGRRQTIEPAGHFEPLDRGGLAQPGSDGLADVGGLKIETPVDLSADLADHPHAFELHHCAVGTHQREQADDGVTFLEIDDVLTAALHDSGLRAHRLGHLRDCRRP